MKLGSFLYSLIIILTFTSCQDDDSNDPSPVATGPTPYELELPAHFFYINPPVIPEDNPMTVEGVALGKKLFYEKKLSRDNSISCGSCHQPQNAFNDKGNAFSAGVDGTLGDINAMPLFNLAWVSITSKKFNWAGSATTLEEQAFGPVVHPKEMKESWPNVVSKLMNDESYPSLFCAAFGDELIDSTRIVKAIAQFERTLISGDSRADKYVQKEVAGLDIPGGPFLTAQELRGFDLFEDEGKGDCAHCHGSFFNPLWTDNRFTNNGLDADPDSGLASVTKNSSDFGKFKTPSLRNLLFTAPYMHDGRFNTIREVVDFYADDVNFNSPNIDAVIVKPRFLSDEEREDLVAFLEAITDSSFINNPDFRP